VERFARDFYININKKGKESWIAVRPSGKMHERQSVVARER